MDGVLWRLVAQFRDEILLIAVATLAAVVRAMGVTIESGQTGLLFSFGRARRTLEPGFHLLLPFLQKARKLPTRSRTLDLPAQRVVTRGGLVYHAEANLVYRVVDVRKALIEVDELEKGMLQMLGLGVQEVLRGADRADFAEVGQLDRRLTESLSRRLSPWGVAAERAGFPSITPSRATLRITQIGRNVEERVRARSLFEGGGLPEGSALGLIGPHALPYPRTRHRIAAESGQRERRRLRAELYRRGWLAVQVQGAVRAHRSRASGERRRSERLRERPPQAEMHPS